MLSSRALVIIKKLWWNLELYVFERFGLLKYLGSCKVLTLNSFICSNYYLFIFFTTWKSWNKIQNVSNYCLNKSVSQQESKQGLFNEGAASSAHCGASSGSCIDKCRLQCIGLGTIDIARAKTHPVVGKFSWCSERWPCWIHILRKRW